MAKSSNTSFDDALLYVEGIIVPPLVVAMKKGWGPEVVLNCVLCLCAWIPGVLHAWLVVARNPSRPRMTAYDEAYLD